MMHKLLPSYEEIRERQEDLCRELLLIQYQQYRSFYGKTSGGALRGTPVCGSESACKAAYQSDGDG